MKMNEPRGTPLKKWDYRSWFIKLLCMLCFLLTFCIGVLRNWSTELPKQIMLDNRSVYVVLTAAHLKLGSDGSTRLRIIAHNLEMLLPLNNSLTMEMTKSILIVSHDGSRTDAQSFVDKWLKEGGKRLVTHVFWEPNDPVKVDLAKWVVPLRMMKQALASNAVRRVILINDSFLLVRKVPELLEERGDVLGLVWTGPTKDIKRHIQSYLRSLSARGILAFMDYYEKESKSLASVSQVIRKFEIYLGWAPTAVQVLYDAVVNGHPDSDAAQRELLPKGFPAIKLKKYHSPQDPWINQDKKSRPLVSPYFSEDIYRKSNHDLNHLSDKQLRNHFTSFGWEEGRVYSTLPLQIKGWLREFLVAQEANSTLAILEEHLQSINIEHNMAQRTI